MTAPCCGPVVKHANDDALQPLNRGVATFSIKGHVGQRIASCGRCRRLEVRIVDLY